MKALTRIRSAVTRLKGTVALFRGQFTPETHQSLIFWHCLTNGYFTDWLSYAKKQSIQGFPSDSLSTIFSGESLGERSEIVHDLRVNGYHVLRERIGSKLCDAMISVIAKTPANVRRRDADICKPRNIRYCFEDPPQGVIYDCSFADLMQAEIFQSLVSEPLFLSVAADYLGTIPKLDPCNAWWTVSSKDKDDSLAQEYHFDMDTIRWLKVFIYLSDVTPQNGPHCFMEGTHRSGMIPLALRKKGYSRLTDEEVFRYFPKQNEITFNGAKGTVIFEDTRGLHKGQPVLEGSRLILSLQFSNVLFKNSEQQMRMNHHHKLSWEDVVPISANFKQVLQQYPEIFRKYLPSRVSSPQSEAITK
jgi:hypothetical protein